MRPFSYDHFDGEDINSTRARRLQEKQRHKRSQQGGRYPDGFRRRRRSEEYDDFDEHDYRYGSLTDFDDDNYDAFPGYGHRQ